MSEKKRAPALMDEYPILVYPSLAVAELNDIQKRIKQANIRAVQKGCIGDLTIEQWLYTLDWFSDKTGEYQCAYCGSVERAMNLTIEHFVPLSMHGNTTMTNCIPSCHECNSLKGAKHGDYFLKVLIERYRSTRAEQSQKRIFAYIKGLAS